MPMKADKPDLDALARSIGDDLIMRFKELVRDEEARFWLYKELGIPISARYELRIKTGLLVQRLGRWLVNRRRNRESPEDR